MAKCSMQLLALFALLIITCMQVQLASSASLPGSLASSIRRIFTSSHAKENAEAVKKAAELAKEGAQTYYEKTKGSPPSAKKLLAARKAALRAKAASPPPS